MVSCEWISYYIVPRNQVIYNLLSLLKLLNFFLKKKRLLSIEFYNCRFQFILFFNCQSWSLKNDSIIFSFLFNGIRKHFTENRILFLRRWIATSRACKYIQYYKSLDDNVRSYFISFVVLLITAVRTLKRDPGEICMRTYGMRSCCLHDVQNTIRAAIGK